jgi:hypothetical protein
MNNLTIENKQRTKMGILVTGARDWNNLDVIYQTLAKHRNQNQEITLIHGGCVGTDILSDKVAKELDFTVDEKLPDWKKYSRAAGPKRNKEMITELLNYEIKYMFAFHNCLAQSKGTKNCVEQAKRVKIYATNITEQSCV